MRVLGKRHLPRLLGVEAILEGHAWRFVVGWSVVGAFWAIVWPMIWAATIALLFSGCVASNLADVMEKMGDNPATVCITVNTVYGTGKALRSNVTNGKVKCDMDGMSVDTVAP